MQILLWWGLWELAVLSLKHNIRLELPCMRRRQLDQRRLQVQPRL